MTPHEFIAKWKQVNLSERSACQQHFLDLCDVLGQQKPAAADPEGAWYTFERGVHKTDGGQGWADVWMRGHFGWEYKGKHKNLAAAYQQLLLYREDLENPPLLVVCDLDRFEVHTNFTGTAKQVYRFDLDHLLESSPHAPREDSPTPRVAPTLTNLDLLRKLFTDPQALRPGETTEAITRRAAEQFGRLADNLRVRGIPAPAAAHFLMKLMFCMFGEDIGLLSGNLFTRVLSGARREPRRLAQMLADLFDKMAHGGYFGADEVLHFNGGLFADADVIELQPHEIQLLVEVSRFDWSWVEPSIFGTLFERTLDPAKRSQIGAHYTSREDILTLLEPVVMTPLRREWAAVRQRCDELREKLRTAPARAGAKGRDTKHRRDHDKLLRDFVERLAHVTILDPACGSGNFLYVAINLLLDLEKEVIAYAATHGTTLLPQVRPTQLSGIEINPYAQQLAQVVIWIGYLQWMHHNGFNPPRNPVLEPIESIRLMDAILDLSDPANPKEPEWPEAEFIVGNPPFLGDKKMRAELGSEYVDALFRVYNNRIRNQSDLCCYWFEKARARIEKVNSRRTGLLATQGIRGGANREVLRRIKETGGIFFAESDRPWILDGANVHVSMVGFDDGSDSNALLDSASVPSINANLTVGSDVTTARRLTEHADGAFIGVSMHGPFEIAETLAVRMLRSSGNPNGRPNSSVVRPILNALEITRRAERRWVVAFPPQMSLDDAAMYSEPFEYIRQTVKPIRDANRRTSYRDRWWVHGESRPAMLARLEECARVIATPRVGKHRVFVWVTTNILPSDATVAFPGADDYTFGILHSHAHEIWALTLGTRLETRPRYTPTTCFETFPFPQPTASQSAAIAAAAAELDRLRNNWLHPPEWTREEVLEFPGSVDGPWARYVHDADARGIGTVRYPRLVPRDEDCAKQLAKRTLTNLYNQRPTWLDLAHRRLDATVAAAYGWREDLADEEILARLLALNLDRGQ